MRQTHWHAINIYYGVFFWGGGGSGRAFKKSLYVRIFLTFDENLSEFLDRQRIYIGFVTKRGTLSICQTPRTDRSKIACVSYTFNINYFFWLHNNFFLQDIRT